MPLAEPLVVASALLAAPRWRAMFRIDTTGGNVLDVVRAIDGASFERLVYAEGDSWFDKFTPIPRTGTNLLDAIRTPFAAAVVDVSHIGSEVREMVNGRQARQTKAMFDTFDFDAIALSAGGNDLKNVFAELFASRALLDNGLPAPWSEDDLARLSRPASYAEFFGEVVGHIRSFVALRDASRRQRVRSAPILLHGYDYLQPRPAGAEIFAGSRVGRGPWLYPPMLAAGLGDAQMRRAADAVVDELNEQLAAQIATLPNVHVIDQRGLLVPAAPGTTGEDADWLDEIHPNEGGFTKLARNRWDVPLSKALGWAPGAGDTVPAAPPSNTTTALRGNTPPAG